MAKTGASTVTEHGTVWLDLPTVGAGVFPSKRLVLRPDGSMGVVDSGTYLAYHGAADGMEWDGPALRRFKTVDEALKCIREHRNK